MIRYALLVPAMALAAGAACADERSAALVAAFQESCITEPPNFARIEGRAIAANLPVNIDAGVPRQPEGPFNHLKSWIVAIATGSYELSANEARGPAGEVAACAITAADAHGEDVKQDLMRTLSLGPPGRELVSPDGTRRSAWHVKVQDETVILLLIDATPTNAPGVYMNITHRLVAGS